MTAYCLLGSQWYKFHCQKIKIQYLFRRAMTKPPTQPHWELQLVQRGTKPITPAGHLTNNQVAQDKLNFYMNTKSSQRVKQGKYPTQSNQQPMFQAKHTRIDNQSNNGPKDGFWNMALQSQGRNSYTAANLFVPHSLVLILDDLSKKKNSNKPEDIKAYDMAIGRYDNCLGLWVRNHFQPLNHRVAVAHEMRFVQPRPRL